MAIINRERVALGIAALRSGEYRRGRSYLHRVYVDGGQEWCCLGVFTDVAIRNGLQVSRVFSSLEEFTPGDRIEIFDDHEQENLCPAVRRWYGFRDQDPDLLSDQGLFRNASVWNDLGPPRGFVIRGDFTDIADGFERTFITAK